MKPSHLGAAPPTADRRLAAVLVVLVGIVSGAGLVGPVGPAAAAPPPAWNVLTGFPPPPIPESVSCSSFADCVAVGLNNPGSGMSGSILTTTDGGGTWISRTLPAGVEGLVSVSCASTSSCFAVGDAGYIIDSTNGGVTWTIAVKEKAVLGAISCASPAVCVAVGGISTWGTKDAGSKWMRRKLPNPYNRRLNLDGVSCVAGTLDCVVVGQATFYATGTKYGAAFTTTNGGVRWNQGDVPSAVTGLRSASCVSTVDCVAVGDGVVSSTNDGASWEAETLPSGTGLMESVSCATTADCAAVGGDQGLTTADGGGSWTSSTLPTSDSADSVSCVSTTDCIAVGPSGAGTVVASSDGGGTWSNQTLPSGLGFLTNVTCPTSSVCLATDGLHLITASDGGTTWADGTVPAGDDGFGGIACPSASTCIAVGNNAFVMTSDGGTTWTNDTPATGGGEGSVSCGSSSNCVAVGGFGIEVTDDGGTTWSSATAPGQPFLNSVSCASALDCVAVGFGATGNNDIVSTADGGTTWTGDDVATGGIDLFSVSCASTQVCNVAGKNTVFTTSDGGTTWTEQTLSGVGDLSCASPADCVSVGYESIFTTSDGGMTWTVGSAPSGATALIGVSCVSTTQCVAVGLNSQGGGIVTGYDDPAPPLSTTTTSPMVTPSATTSRSTVSYSATVAPVGGSGTPSGSVTFTTGTAWLCTAVLSAGAGSCTDPTAPTGLDTVTAVYSGDSTFASSSASTTLHVNSGVACAALSGSVSGTISLKLCTPSAPTLKSASAPATVLTAGGTLTWAKRGQTTVVSLSSTSDGQGACAGGSTEHNVSGTVTGGTSTSTVAGDLVNLSVCQTGTGALSLAPGTTAVL